VIGGASFATGAGLAAAANVFSSQADFSQAGLATAAEVAALSPTVTVTSLAGSPQAAVLGIYTPSGMGYGYTRWTNTNGAVLVWDGNAHYQILDGIYTYTANQAGLLGTAFADGSGNIVSAALNFPLVYMPAAAVATLEAELLIIEGLCAGVGSTAIGPFDGPCGPLVGVVVTMYTDSGHTNPVQGIPNPCTTTATSQGYVAFNLPAGTFYWQAVLTGWGSQPGTVTVE
jgi:hypothetical protein